MAAGKGGHSSVQAEFPAASGVAWSRVLYVSASQVSSPGKGRVGLDQASQQTFRCPDTIHPEMKCTDDGTSPFENIFTKQSIAISVTPRRSERTQAQFALYLGQYVSAWLQPFQKE